MVIKDYSDAQVISREIDGTLVLVRQAGGQAYPVLGDPSVLAIDASAGAADAGKTTKLDSDGRLDRTLLAPDGRQRQQRLILSDTGDVDDMAAAGGPTFSGTFFDSFLQIHGTSQTDTGFGLAKWGNDNKGIRIVLAKSRGASYGNFATVNAGDRIASIDLQVAYGASANFGHAGNVIFLVDGTTDGGSEMPGRIQFYTGTGNNIGENATYYGVRIALDMNRHQQVYLPGKLTAVADIPAADSDFGAILRIGKGGTSLAAIRFDLTGAALLTTPVGGCFEVDSAGQPWWTLSGGTRGKLVIAGTTTDVLTGTATDRAVTPDSLAALWKQGSDVASAGTISLGEGGYFNITGTTTITDIDFATDKAGRHAFVRFTGALILTHNSSTLILPGGVNITTAAGDTACFVSEDSDAVRCLFYRRAIGDKRLFVSQIVGTALAASEVLLTLMPPSGETWTLPGNLSTSSGKKVTGGTNPAATYTIDLQKNGSSVGSIVISTSGVVTFSTTSGAAIMLTGGTDILQAIGPASPDTALGYVLSIAATSTL